MQVKHMQTKHMKTKHMQRKHIQAHTAWYSCQVLNVSFQPAGCCSLPRTPSWILSKQSFKMSSGSCFCWCSQCGASPAPSTSCSGKINSMRCVSLACHVCCTCCAAWAMSLSYITWANCNVCIVHRVFDNTELPTLFCFCLYTCYKLQTVCLTGVVGVWSC